MFLWLSTLRYKHSLDVKTKFDGKEFFFTNLILPEYFTLAFLAKIPFPLLISWKIGEL